MKVFIIAALTADGFIAHTEKDTSTNWTSDEDRKLFVRLTKRAGVFVMGSTTYRTIGRALPGRRNIVYSRTKIAQEGIETTSETPAALIQRLEAEGYDELAICGGTTIYDMFLQADVVDELYLTIEPVLFGTGLPLIKTARDIPLKLIESTLLNADTLLVHYEVQK